MLWPRLAQWARVSDLRDALFDRFDADREVIEADLIAFLADLAKNDFVQVEA
jgi:hypothetical protein